MLVQEVEPQLVRPPVAVRRAAAGGVIERALRFGLARCSWRSFHFFGKGGAGRRRDAAIEVGSLAEALNGPMTYLGYNDRVTRLSQGEG